MTQTLKTEELFFEVNRRENGTHTLNIYHITDEDMMIEAYLSDREMAELIKTLTRVHLGLKPY